ncbi:phospholipase/Carboxylesterase [Beauveria bassiana ARSEF 2860]|uniref:Phospholipase/Carboxylesterase n=1 Tax=Beauveria bassiana (strain ARSEF 2860) TaxID=655819 RepID=J5JW95_BEAB2|nr:phospholipase/Carboxylesterase [Beauveria bassiana ARSEF 2860]EJP68898.1 phospholipase/Carboxylesterase [Beauveria bassiana ARSEF 2860]
MEPNTTSTYIHGPAKGHTHAYTVIFLHGRDSNAQEFAEELFESEASTGSTSQPGRSDSATPPDRTLPGLLPAVRWVFPAAPILHSQRFDTDLSQWFDMWAVEDPGLRSEIQRSGLHRSVQTVLAIIDDEEKLISRGKIFLCGISQGFATALSVLFAQGQGGFAGVIGLCSWLPFSSQVEAAITKHNSEASLFSAVQGLYRPETETFIAEPLPSQIKDTPVLLEHASDDDVVPIANGQRMKNVLTALGLNVKWHEYKDGGHWVNEPQGVDDIVAFIRANLK